MTPDRNADYDMARLGVVNYSTSTATVLFRRLDLKNQRIGNALKAIGQWLLVIQKSAMLS